MSNGRVELPQIPTQLDARPLLVFLVIIVPFVAIVAAVETGRLDPLTVLIAFWIGGIVSICYAAFSTWKIWQRGGIRAVLKDTFLWLNVAVLLAVVLWLAPDINPTP